MSDSSKLPPRLAVSIGCPSGVGPEISVAASRIVAQQGLRALLVGDPGVLSRAAALVGASWSEVPVVHDHASLSACDAPICVFSPIPSLALSNCEPGRPCPAGGRAQLAWVDAATDLVVEKLADAIVTGPVSKEVIARSGAPGAESFRGHTEHIARRVGAPAPIMIFVADDMAVALVTTHLQLSRVSEAITQDKVIEATVRCAETVRGLGKRPARVVVAALNPHAGEHGLLGHEDDEVIAPAVASARDRLADLGIEAVLEGPCPAEAAFRIAFDGGHDGVVAMYHDQGTIPMKVRYFGRAVNVTAGLPIVRTSVDHGTAYDIAGKGKADASSMVEAMRLAARLAAQHRAV
jgi:4-hydroxythreonine-4-phosphate dehydrogenase